MGLLKQFSKKDYYKNAKGNTVFRIHQKSPPEFAQYCQQVTRARKKGKTNDISQRILNYFKRKGFNSQEDFYVALDYFDSDLETSIFSSGYVLSFATDSFLLTEDSKKLFNSLDYFNMAFNLTSRAQEDINSAIEICDDPDEIDYFLSHERAVANLKKRIYFHSEFPQNVKKILALEKSLERALRKKDFLKASLINEKIDSLTQFRDS